MIKKPITIQLASGLEAETGGSTGSGSKPVQQ